MISEIESRLKNINEIFNTQLDEMESVISIYLFGGYVRSDFVKGKSDIDFAVVLDVPKNSHHWNHFVFQKVKSLIYSQFDDISNKFFRSNLNPIDVVSFSKFEIEQAIDTDLTSSHGPLKLLTFYAFDFVKHNRLIWGKDILNNFVEIPKPKIYAEQRLKYINKVFSTKKYDKQTQLILALGSIIKHFAVLSGIREISKYKLKKWVKGNHVWTNSGSSSLIFDNYFDYILNENTDIEILNEEWQEETEKFVTKILAN